MNDQARYKNSFDSCPLTFALNLIGGKWRLPIIWALHKNGTMRYNELQRGIYGITHMMLTESLKELESHSIVQRKQFMEVPPRVEYSLTEQGEELIPALKALADWGKKMKTVINDNGAVERAGSIPTSLNPGQKNGIGFFGGE